MKANRLYIVCFIQNLLDADAVVDSTESLKDEETGILNEVIQTGYQEEIIDKDLKSNNQLTIVF